MTRAWFEPMAPAPEPLPQSEAMEPTPLYELAAQVAREVAEGGGDR